MWGRRPLFPMLRNQGIPSTRETGSGLLVVTRTSVGRGRSNDPLKPSSVGGLGIDSKVNPGVGP